VGLTPACGAVPASAEEAKEAGIDVDVDLVLLETAGHKNAHRISLIKNAHKKAKDSCEQIQTCDRYVGHEVDHKPVNPVVGKTMCPCNGDPGCGCTLPCGVKRKCPKGCIPDPDQCAVFKKRGPLCCPEYDMEEGIPGALEEAETDDWLRACWKIGMLSGQKPMYYDDRCADVANNKPCADTGPGGLACQGCAAKYGKSIDMGEGKQILVKTPFCRFCNVDPYSAVKCKGPPPPRPLIDLSASG